MVSETCKGEKHVNRNKGRQHALHFGAMLDASSVLREEVHTYQESRGNGNEVLLVPGYLQGWSQWPPAGTLRPVAHPGSELVANPEHEVRPVVDYHVPQLWGPLYYMFEMKHVPSAQAREKGKADAAVGN